MNETDAVSEKKSMVSPEQQDSSTYIGLLLGGIILATGTIVLLSDLYSTFSTKGIDITFAIIFRMGLLLASAYGAISCFFALYRMALLNKMLSKKIGEEFEDFVLYTRPFIEEVIKQRLVVEKVINKLETLDKRNIGNATPQQSQSPVSIKLWEFLFYIALLTNISIGLFVYLEAHPFEMVPYSVIILGIAWWVLMAKYFGLLFDPRGIYIPAFFIAALPTLSIVLRIFLAPYQALFIVFLVLFFYVALMYYYYRYITTGIPLFSIAKLREEIEASKKAMAKKPVAFEIGAKRERILEKALSKIKRQKAIKPVPQVISKQPEISTLKISLSDLIRSTIRSKIQSIRISLMSLIWPYALCQHGRKISYIGLLMALLGIIYIIFLPGSYEDVFLEALFLGIVLMPAGYSLARKRGKRIFTWLTLLYFLGIITSLWSIRVFFHFTAFPSFEELQDLALTYILGLLLIVLNMLMEYKFRIRFYPEISEQGMKLNQQKARWLIKTMRKNVNRARL